MSAAETEALLRAALERLVTGTPKNADLLKLAHRLGKVRINLASVCKEAGFSRGVLGDTNSIYRELRQEILEYEQKPNISIEELQLRQLELENLVSELRDRIDMRDVQNAELLVKLRRAQQKGAVATMPVEKRNAALKVVTGQ